MSGVENIETHEETSGEAVAENVEIHATEPLTIVLSPDEESLIRLLFAHNGSGLSNGDFQALDEFQGSGTKVRAALYPLIDKVNAATGQLLITRTGEKRGTKYTIDHEIASTISFVVQRTPDPKLHKERIKTNQDTELMERLSIVSALVSLYAQHPTVIRAINHTKKSDFAQVVSNDALRDYRQSFNSHDLLTPSDEKILFSDLSRAVSLYRSFSKDHEMTAAEELVLIHGVTAHQLIFSANLRLAYQFSRPYWGQGLDELEIVQEANRGLLGAIARFDFEKDFKFSTYAVPWIQQFPSRALDNKSRTIRIPVHKMNEIVKTRGLVRKESMQLGRDLADDEMQALIGMSVSDYTALQALDRPRFIELDAPLRDDGEAGTMHELRTTHQESPEIAVEHAERRDFLAKLLGGSSISNMQRMIIGLRSAIEPDLLPGLEVDLHNGHTVRYSEVMATTKTSSGRTLEEVGEILKIDIYEVRKLESKAFIALRAKTNDDPQAHASA